jgi:urease subunit gamma
MQLTPREFDKLLIYMMADVALKRKTKGLKLNYPEAVAVISAVALEGARAGKTIEDVTKDARTALTKADVMDGVADLIPMVQIGSRVYRRQPARDCTYTDPVKRSTGGQYGRTKNRALCCRRCRSGDDS